MKQTSRRTFLGNVAATTALCGMASCANTQEKPGPKVAIQGFDETETAIQKNAVWKPISDRKVRMGIVGFGYCKFGAVFGFQDHPNVEVVAVSDLIPERCAGLAKACRCKKTYPSLEEMVKDDSIEAIFLATDAPSHARHSMLVLAHGKHVASAVPAVFGSLEDAEKLYEAGKRSGLHYMMFETSAYRGDCYAMRTLYNAGNLGKLIYSEGEYYHYSPTIPPSYKGWRNALPPLWYPTHSTAYYVCVTGGHFTEVSCMGMPSLTSFFNPEKNPYNNPFGTEVGLFRTDEGGMARMTVSYDTPGLGGERGRVRGQRGSVTDMTYRGLDDISGIELAKPPLPPNVSAGGHGGSHGYLTEEFITALLQDRTPLVNVAWALNMTVPGVVAHQSALKGGELLKVPHYTF